MGLIAWSPLAGGVLTGKYQIGIPQASRGDSERWHYLVKPYLSDEFGPLMQLLREIALATGISMEQVALLWLQKRNQISSILIGPSNVMQLEPLIKVNTLSLDEIYSSQLDKASNRYRFYNPRSESL